VDYWCRENPECINEESMGIFLSEKERIRFKEQHRRTKERRPAYRINAILLLDDGWTYEEVAEVLMLDDQTIRRWEEIFQKSGLEGLLKDDFHGRIGKLSLKQELELKAHLESKLYETTKEIVLYVNKFYRVAYSIPGMHHLLRRLGFVYKKTRRIPQSVDAEHQKLFVEQYEELQKSRKDGSKVLFADGVHPQHNPVASSGWIPKGKEYHIAANSGRERLNLNGALDPKTLEVTIREDKTLDADSTIEFIKQIEKKYPHAPIITLIVDNARYYRAIKVQEYLETSRVRFMFLPPYSPNLNLIERLWGFFKKAVLYNKFYPRFSEFKQACFDFFSSLDSQHLALRSLITENFQIITPRFR